MIRRKKFNCAQNYFEIIFRVDWTEKASPDIIHSAHKEAMRKIEMIKKNYGSKM
jgi:hypothetical protein